MALIKIVEVGPRDGLQNERRIQSLATKARFVTDLARTGLRHIEIGAFVSPKWVPQMADSSALCRRILGKQKRDRLPRGVEFGALVPNEFGMREALRCGMRSIAVFGACSETFSVRNINCSIAESISRFESVIAIARANRLRVRGYLSTAFGCPFEGPVPIARVVRLVDAYLRLGVEEISLGDTIGVATPKQVGAVLRRVLKVVPPSKLAMHFHDTRGTALANVCESLRFGVRIFDSSLGGLGGCPYADGAAGNLATEDLVYTLHGLGHRTGVDIERLIRIRRYMEDRLDHDLPSKVSRAGSWP
jgi:hydroxymethylglutaryl-CoA lyase